MVGRTSGSTPRPVAAATVSSNGRHLAAGAIAERSAGRPRGTGPCGPRAGARLARRGGPGNTLRPPAARPLAGARALVGAARRGTPQGCVLERPGERPAGVRAGGLRHGPARFRRRALELGPRRVGRERPSSRDTLATRRPGDRGLRLRGQPRGSALLKEVPSRVNSGNRKGRCRCRRVLG